MAANMHVIVSMPGQYQPDVFDDAMNRIVTMFREALAVRLAAYPELAQEEAPGE
jgi:predicted DNA-binding protein (UPF0251 family)